MSEPLVVRRAPSSEPQYEPTYNICRPLQQDLDRVRHINQNKNTLQINRQIIHARRNRNFQNPRNNFNIPESPTPSPLDLSSSTIPDTPPIASQQSTSNIPSDYLGSTPTSKKFEKTLLFPQQLQNVFPNGLHTPTLEVN